MSAYEYILGPRAKFGVARCHRLWPSHGWLTPQRGSSVLERSSEGRSRRHARRHARRQAPTHEAPHSHAHTRTNPRTHAPTHPRTQLLDAARDGLLSKAEFEAAKSRLLGPIDAERRLDVVPQRALSPLESSVGAHVPRRPHVWRCAHDGERKTEKLVDQRMDEILQPANKVQCIWDDGGVTAWRCTECLGREEPAEEGSTEVKRGDCPYKIRKQEVRGMWQVQETGTKACEHWRLLV